MIEHQANCKQVFLLEKPQGNINHLKKCLMRNRMKSL